MIKKFEIQLPIEHADFFVHLPCWDEREKCDVYKEHRIIYDTNVSYCTYCVQLPDGQYLDAKGERLNFDSGDRAWTLIGRQESNGYVMFSLTTSGKWEDLFFAIPEPIESFQLGSVRVSRIKGVGPDFVPSVMHSGGTITPEYREEFGVYMDDVLFSDPEYYGQDVMKLSCQNEWHDAWSDPCGKDWLLFWLR